MIVAGLTGSIGMGKSTTAEMFRREGVRVHDSDHAVHALYSGAAVPLIDEAFPGVVVDGRVDRTRLAMQVLHQPQQMARLEAIVHPLVSAHRREFLARARDDGEQLVLLDIPLLFETGADRELDAIIVVTAPSDVQRERVLARPGMTPAKFTAILARQLPDEEKRRRADFVVDTSKGIAAVEQEVHEIVHRLREQQKI